MEGGRFGQYDLNTGSHEKHFLSFIYSPTSKTISYFYFHFYFSFLLILLLLVLYLLLLRLLILLLLIPILLVLVLVLPLLLPIIYLLLPLVLPIIYLLFFNWNRCYHKDPYQHIFLFFPYSPSYFFLFCRPLSLVFTNQSTDISRSNAAVDSIEKRFDGSVTLKLVW